MFERGLLDEECVTNLLAKGPSPAPAAAWSVLLVFPAVLLLFAAVAIMLWRRQMRTHDKDELPYLDAAWSFKDSWAGDVTVIRGLLTGWWAHPTS